MSELIVERHSQHLQNLQQITEAAHKSFDNLYHKYGIRPNAWIMSKDVVETLKTEIAIHMGWWEPVSGGIKFMDLPVHVVHSEKGLVKATIEEDE